MKACVSSATNSTSPVIRRVGHEPFSAVGPCGEPCRGFGPVPDEMVSIFLILLAAPSVALMEMLDA